MKLSARVFVAGVLILGSLGCSRAAPPLEPVGPLPALTESSSNEKASVSPFALEIVEDRNDGTYLHVHGRVKSEAAWPSDDVVVGVNGVSAGEPKHLAFYRLRSLIQRSDAEDRALLAPREPVDFFLSVPSHGLSDYQIELLWGKEAKAALGRNTPAARTANAAGLVIQELRTERVVRSCPQEPCAANYKLSGMLFNSSNQSIVSAKLGVGFLWVPEGASLDFTAQIPEDEETVEISGLNLQSQQSRPFNLELDRAVPGVSGGKFVPSVRVLSYN